MTSDEALTAAVEWFDLMPKAFEYKKNFVFTESEGDTEQVKKDRIAFTAFMTKDYERWVKLSGSKRQLTPFIVAVLSDSEECRKLAREWIEGDLKMAKETLGIKS